MSSLAIAAAATAIIVGSVFAGGDAKAKRKLKKLFFGRQPKTNSCFYNRFFSTSGVPENIVSKIRQVFQEHVSIDISQLEADDDLSGDFSVIWNLDSLADVEIVVQLEKEFDIIISDEEAKAMTSFRKIVSGVWNKIQEKQKC